MGNVITGQRYDVGLQPVGCVDSSLDLFPAGKGTVVDIGEVNNAKTLEGLWQATQVDRMVLNREHEWFAKSRPRGLAEI